MKRKAAYPYFCAFTVLLGLMSIPKSASEKLQGMTIALLAPALNQVSNLKWGEASPEEEVLKLKLENQLLKNERAILRDFLHNKIESADPVFYQKLFMQEFQSVPAKVIFRSPGSWNSSLWINVGKADNEALPTPIIAKNSPVLLGTAVIGVIDYVGRHQSRVRLITDSGLTPSVRALRGNAQALLIAEQMKKLVEMIKTQEGDSLKRQELIASLEKAIKEIDQSTQSWYLAKGELCGNSKPLWRTNSHILQGIGFNYDFQDAHGPARDLRSGKPQEPNSSLPAMPIIQVHDLLVTTGMDGVFPPNLPIAEVTSVKMLKEGDYFYELEAKPVAGNLNELSLLFVIAPSEYDDQELFP
jgi:cell shape-determining protein MreC